LNYIIIALDNLIIIALGVIIGVTIFLGWVYIIIITYYLFLDFFFIFFFFFGLEFDNPALLFIVYVCISESIILLIYIN